MPHIARIFDLESGRPGRRSPRHRIALAAAVAVACAAGGCLTAAASPAAAGTSGAAKTAVNRAAIDTAADTAATTQGRAGSESAALSAQLAARTKARATGRPVTVSALTTATAETTANPDGTFTLTSSAVPQRIKRDGAWTPVDTGLARTPDGMWAPKVSQLDVAFSAGGTGPMLTLEQPGADGTAQSLSMYWPAALPKPVIAGDAALYRDVLPGVDLQLAASTSSYSEVLIVRSAAAAADPGLAALTLRVRTDNLVLGQAPSGALTADTPSGAAVFLGAPPVMWDSRDRPELGPAPTAADPGSAPTARVGLALGARSATSGPSGARVQTTQVTLTPPASALRGPGVQYPDYIDPSFTTSLVSNDWLDVQANGWTWWGGAGENDNPDAITVAQVGDCDFPSTGCGPGDADAGGNNISYFRMDTGDLAESSGGTYATVTSANFTITESWSADGCVQTPVELFESDGIASSTLYSTSSPIKGSVLASVNTDGGSNCTSAQTSAEFSGSSVTSYLESIASGGGANVTFALRAASFTDTTQWKQFTPGSARVNVTYEFGTSVPTGLAISGAETCNGVNYSTTDTPKLLAQVTDYNPDPAPNLTFSLYHGTTTSLVVTSPSVTTPGNNKQAGWVDTSALVNGDAYSFKAVGGNAGSYQSSASSAYDFTVMSQPPTTAPAVTSFDYPAGFWGQPSNTGGEFSVSSADPDLQGFRFSLTGAQLADDATSCDTTPTQLSRTSGGLLTDGFVPTSGGTATVTINPGNLAPGYHSLMVGAVNYAGEAGPNTTYDFYVAPSYTVGTPAGSATNLAWDAPVTVSSTYSSEWPAANLTDGDTGGGYDFAWSSAAFTTAANTAWCYVDLGSVKSLDDVVLTPREDSVANTDSGFPLGFQIQVSDDASTWTTVDTLANYPSPGTTPQQFVFPETTARYVRVYATDLTTATTGASFYLQLKALQVYDQVTDNRYEAEDSSYFTASDTGGKAGVQSTNAAFSSGGQIFFGAGATGVVDGLTFTPAVGDYYALGANMTRAADYGQIAFSLKYTNGAGTVVSTPLTANGAATFDGYNNGVITQYVQLGGARLTAGTQYTLAMTTTGTDSGTTGNRYDVGVDFVTMAPIASPVATSFAAAMNNHGIGVDGQNTGSAMDLTSNSLSRTDLNNAGLTATAPIEVDGDYYKLTAPASGSEDDNVVALGQTIDLSAPGASSVSLLVVSTHGGTTSGTFTVNYTDPAADPASQVTIGTAVGDQPAVPDWIGPAAGSVSPALTLAGYDHGTGNTNTVAPVGLYRIVVPTNPDDTIASITLPAYNASDVSDYVPTLLHVLAIGTPSTDSGPTETLPSTDTTVNWIGAWTGADDTDSAGNPAAVAPPSGTSGFAGQTLREIIHPTTDGTGSPVQARIRLSDPEGSSTVSFSAVSLAVESGGGADVTSPTPLTFNANTALTLAPGTETYSDPVTLPALSAGDNLVVSIYLPNAESLVPQHSNASAPGAASASYFAAGNQTANTAGTWTALSSWYYVEDLDVTTTDLSQGTVVVLGDQTALGTGPVSGATWVDDLPGALADTSGVTTTAPGGVVNLSSTGATVQSTIDNLESTVEDEPNVRSVIVDLGANDLIAGADPDTDIEPELGSLISMLTQIQSPAAVSVGGTVGPGPLCVYLTTVAPDTAITGDAETDRDTLDSDIVNGDGSLGSAQYQGYIDFDGTATQGSPGSATAGVYLNGTAFNDSYYTALAQTAAVPNDNYSTASEIGSL